MEMGVHARRWGQLPRLLVGSVGQQPVDSDYKPDVRFFSSYTE